MILRWCLFILLCFCQKSNFKLWQAWKKGGKQEERLQESTDSRCMTGGSSGSWCRSPEESSTRVLLFLWITRKESVLLWCLEREISGEKGLCLQFNCYPKDSWLVRYPSSWCAALRGPLHFITCNYKHRVSCPSLLTWIKDSDHRNHISPAFSLCPGCRR